jgi:hypothetical protein
MLRCGVDNRQFNRSIKNDKTPASNALVGAWAKAAGRWFSRRS